MDKALFISAVALLVVVPALASATSCQGDILESAEAKCMTQNGFTAKERSKISSIENHKNIDAKVLKLLCRKKENFKRASTCIENEVKRCPSKAGVIITSRARNISKACDDPKFRIDCFSPMISNPRVLDPCLMSYDTAAELRSKPVHQVVCESGKVGVRCAANLLKVCDKHTAEVFTSIEDGVMSFICGFKSDEMLRNPTDY